MAMYKKKQSARVKKTSTSGRVKGTSGKVAVGKGKGGDSVGWKKSPITGGIAGVIILICIINIFSGGGSGSSGYKADLVCKACNFTTREPLRKGQAYPYECSECDAMELYSGQKCNDCNKNTPSLPPKKSFSCTSCKHTEVVRLQPYKAPHDCPSCNAKTFYETYKCNKCKKDYGFVPKEDPENGMMHMEGMPGDCPECDGQGYSINMDARNTCFHCDSENLASITPIAVIKYEMGRKLNDREKKVVEQWEAKQ